MVFLGKYNFLAKVHMVRYSRNDKGHIGLKVPELTLRKSNNSGMRSKQWKKAVVIVIIAVLGIWTVLTGWVQRERSGNSIEIGNSSSERSALLVYNPDPLYNLDEQLCKSFARALAEEEWHVRITTVSEAKKLKSDNDLYVFCANTYNWAPDVPLREYIEKHAALKGAAVVAITVGSGSTERAHRIHCRVLEDKESLLLGSAEYWLMKPNSGENGSETNVEIALEKAYELGVEVERKFGSTISSKN